MNSRPMESRTVYVRAAWSIHRQVQWVPLPPGCIGGAIGVEFGFSGVRADEVVLGLGCLFGRGQLRGAMV